MPQQNRRRRARIPEEARRAGAGPRLQEPVAVVHVRPGRAPDGRAGHPVERVVAECVGAAIGEPVGVGPGVRLGRVAGEPVGLVVHVRAVGVGAEGDVRGAVE